MKPAFTLIELLLIVAIIGALAGLYIPINQFLQVKNDLEVTTISLTQVIRKAQMLAREGVADAAWGVKLQNNNIILYRGTTFEARDPSFDEHTTISPTIIVSGLDNVNFSKLKGNPQASGAIKLEFKPYEKNITINEKGTVSY